jgi:hypothetical protein
MGGDSHHKAILGEVKANMITPEMSEAGKRIRLIAFWPTASWRRWITLSAMETAIADGIAMA